MKPDIWSAVRGEGLIMRADAEAVTLFWSGIVHSRAAAALERATAAPRCNRRRLPFGVAHSCGELPKTIAALEAAAKSHRTTSVFIVSWLRLRSDKETEKRGAWKGGNSAR